MKIGFSQRPKFNPIQHYYTVENGLPSNETYCIFKDSKGYFWVATDEGVARYNGYSFEVFTTKNGLIDNVVFHFVEDALGRIWFVSYNSLLCYFDNGVIHQYKYNHLIESFLNGRTSNSKELIIDNNGDLTYNLLNVGICRIENGNLIEFKIKDNYYHEIEINHRNYVAHRPNYIAKDSIEIGEIEFICKNKEVKILDQYSASKRVKMAIGDNHANQLVLIYGAVFDLKNHNILYKSKGLLELVINGEDYWICDMNGLFRGRLVNNTIQIQDTLIYGTSVTNIELKDKNVLWFSTLQNGIGQIFLNGIKKAHFENDDTIEIGSMTFYEGKLFFSTSTKLFQLNSNNEYIYKDVFSDKSNYNVPYNEFIVNRNGIVDGWAGVSLYKRIHFTDSFAYIETFRTGMSYLKYGSKRVVTKKFKYPVSTDVLDLYLDDESNGYTWNRRHLFRIVNDHGRIINLPDYNGNKSIISSFAKVSDKFLIVGTSNNGILVLRNNRHYYLNESNGFLQNKINGIELLSNGFFCVYGSKGVELINLEDFSEKLTYTINHFGEFPDINIIKEYKNNLYIGAKTGLFNLGIEEIKRELEVSKKVPQFYLKINNQTITKINETKVFPAEIDLIDIKIDILDYTKLFDKKYQFSLNESGEWISIEDPRIRLVNPSGEFTVQFRYENADLTWSKPIFLGTYHVNTVWYKTIWFITLVILFIVSLIAFFIKRQQVNKIQKLKEQNQLLELEQQMQRARLNPHFVFNVLNSIHSFMLHEDKEMAEKYLNRFSKLMREVLNQTKDGVTDLKTEISILDKYLELEQLRGKFNFLYTIQVPDNLKMDLKIPSLMIQPFVENAVLHRRKDSENAIIDIRFQPQDSVLIVRIINAINTENSDQIRQAIQNSSASNAIGIVSRRLEKYASIRNEKKIGLIVSTENDKLQIELHLPIL